MYVIYYLPSSSWQEKYLLALSPYMFMENSGSMFLPYWVLSPVFTHYVGAKQISDYVIVKRGRKTDLPPHLLSVLLGFFVCLLLLVLV